MGRHRKYVIPEIALKFQHEYSVELPNGKTIEAGENIKISGEYGGLFRFDSFTTNIETGSSWIECREFYKGQIGQYRAFYINRVKKIPVRRKRVSRKPAS
jgi:hypothetical protein